MASEDVCIILNERESNKAKTAETLLLKLKENNITASRLKADPKLAQILTQRTPKVIILDYVIGDYTTGLDIVNDLSNSEFSPEFIFLTDEPSVPVAVDAMRLGAKNYFEITNPEAITSIVEETKAILKNRNNTPRQRGIKERFKLKNFVAQSETSLKLLAEANKLAARKAPVTIICGVQGSGRSCLAEGIHNGRNSASFLRTCDWDMYAGRIEDLFGYDNSSAMGLRLGENLSVIIDHVTLEDQDLLSFCAEKIDKNWSLNEESSNDSFLTICTTEKECAHSWGKIFNATPLLVPALKLRKEDIPALTRAFVAEVADLYSVKAKTLDIEAIKELVQLDWPGNIKQLRAVVFDAAVSTLTTDLNWGKALKDSYDRSIEYLSTPPHLLPTPLTVANIVERCDGNLRISAATLGIPISKVRSLLKPSDSIPSKES